MATALKEKPERKRKGVSALELKQKLQKKVRSRIDHMPGDLTYLEKVKKMAEESELAEWWHSLPGK